MDTLEYKEAESYQSSKAYEDAALEKYGEINAENGKKGGNALIKKYGVERMRELGRKGGTATKKKLGIEHYRELGRRNHASLTPEALADRSSKGGEATKKKYGKEHYQRMAKLSIEAKFRRRNDEKDRQQHILELVSVALQHPERMNEIRDSLEGGDREVFKSLTMFSVYAVGGGNLERRLSEETIP